MITFTLAYYEEYTFPPWADGLGWMIGLITLVPMPVFAIFTWKTGTIVRIVLFVALIYLILHLL